LSHFKITMPDGKINELEVQRCATYAEIRKYLATSGTNADDIILTYHDGTKIVYNDMIFKDDNVKPVKMSLAIAIKSVKVNFKGKIMEIPVKNENDKLENIKMELSKITKVDVFDILKCSD